MKIDPKLLSHLRKEKGWSRPQLAERSGITVRTIQRLESESESQRCQKSQEHTVNSLANALDVKSGVLTGELPPLESDKASAPDPKPVPIGAQIAPKVRLAYALIKCRYSVSATEIINMGPLLFALLAEGSLAWRREKLKEMNEAIDRLEQIDGFWRESLGFGAHVVNKDIAGEEDSIAKADLFGEHLLDSDSYEFFDSSRDNPFASYLRKLKAELAIPDVVDVDGGALMFGSPSKFPDYDICREDLNGIANGSASAKVALETGHARLSEIPEELMVEDAGEERAKWLMNKLPDTFKDLEKKREDLEKRMKDLEKEIKEKDDRIEEMPETYPESVSEKDIRKEFRKWMKLREERDKLWEELVHLKEKRREGQSRLEMLITEEKDRSTSLSGTITYPEGNSKDIGEADSQEANSDIKKRR